MFIYIILNLGKFILTFYSTWDFTILSNFNITSIFFFFFSSGFVLSLFLYFISSTRVFLLFGVLIIIIFPILLICFFFFKNIFTFILIYECFILPSTIIVWFFSPNRRFLMANIYFLMWTQVGSFLIILVLFWVYINHKIIYIFNLKFTFGFWTSLFLVVGFGVKIPIWPFHFWLTKTHVEAPTFFSIYLSGFLVKTAILGFLIFLPSLHSYIIYILFCITVIGIFDSTFKMMVQVDLKKIVAYATIQEMNIILMYMLFQNTLALNYVGFFILTHTILSTLLFYTTDILYKRFKSRSVTSTYGLYNNNMLMGWCLIILIFLYLGFPGSIKFFLEINLFIWLLFFNKYIFFLTIIVLLWVGAITFTRPWFLSLFGVNILKKPIFFLKKDLIILWTFYIIYLILPYMVNM